MHSVSTMARTTAVFLASTIFLLLTMNDAAFARISTSTARSNTIQTTIWGNVLTPVGSTANKTPLVFTWAQSTGAQYTYADLVNVGNLASTGQSIVVTTQDANSSRQDAPDLQFSSCSGVWNQTTNACSGSITSLGNITNGTLGTKVALSIGQRVTLRIVAQKTKKALWTSTLSIGVSRSQVRTATTTNS